MWEAAGGERGKDGGQTLLAVTWGHQGKSFGAPAAGEAGRGAAPYAMLGASGSILLGAP